MDIYFTFWVIVVVQPTQLCPTLCNPMDGGTPGLSVPHHLLKFAQVHVYGIGDAIIISSSDALFSFCPQSLGNNPILLYFLAQVVPTLVLGSFSYVPLIYFHHCVF